MTDIRNPDMKSGQPTFNSVLPPVLPRPKYQPYVIGSEHIVTARITTTDNPEGYDYKHEQPDIPTFVNLYPNNIGYCPIHKTQYISDNCVICTKPWEEK